jgi:hypothetical protein
MAVCDWLRMHELRRRLQRRVGGAGRRETAHDIGRAEASSQEREDQWLDTVYALKTLGKGLGLGSLHQIHSQGLGALLGRRGRCARTPITARQCRRSWTPTTDVLGQARRNARQQSLRCVGDAEHAFLRSSAHLAVHMSRCSAAARACCCLRAPS